MAESNDVQKTISEIRHIMQTRKTYSPSFELAIELCAELRVLRQLAFDEVQSLGMTVEEESREGNPRTKANPLINSYLEICKVFSGTLSELRLTAKSSTDTESDDLVDLIGRVNSAVTQKRTNGERGAKGTKSNNGKRPTKKGD